MGVTAYAQHPVVDGPWDASAAEARGKKWAGIEGDVADATPAQRHKFGELFAGVRGDGSTQADYVLPHHDVRDGKLVTVKAGVSAALGRVDQVEGFSPEEKAAMRRHLERHRAEWSHPMRCPSIPILMEQIEPISKTWNQIARAGTWKGHPQGEINFNDEIYRQIIANHESTINARVQVDQEHLSETLDHPTIAETGAPAMAWITKIETRGNELWALFEWVDHAAVANVKAGKTMFVSPAVVFNAFDRVTGEPIGARLTSVALTNHPFIDGMEPLIASDTVRASLSPDAVHIPAAIGEQKKNAAKGPKAMAEVNQDGQKNETMSEAHKALADKHAGFMKKMRKMADVGENEGLEDEDIFEALSKKLAEHKEMKASEHKRMAEESASEADDMAEHDEIPKTAAAREVVIAMRMKNRPMYDALYGEKLKAIRAKRAQPVTQLSERDRVLLTGRVDNGAMPVRAATVPDDATDDHGALVMREIDAMRAKGEDKRFTESLALFSEASRRVKQTQDAALSSALRSLMNGAQ